MFCYWSYHTVTLFILAAVIGWWREYLLRKDFSIQTSLKAAQDFLKNQNELLESEVEKRTRKIQANAGCDHRTFWRRWWRPAITKPAITSAAPSTMSGPSPGQLQSHPAFAGYLVEHQMDILFKSAPLHDIGKVGIPDRSC